MGNFEEHYSTQISELNNYVSQLHNEINHLCNAFSSIRENLSIETRTVNSLGKALRLCVQAEPSLKVIPEVQHALKLVSLVAGEVD
jgi:phage host-nuclease inhibitor protein Gam